MARKTSLVQPGLVDQMQAQLEYLASAADDHEATADSYIALAAQIRENARVNREHAKALNEAANLLEAAGVTS